jgi:hypothetical protein
MESWTYLHPGTRQRFLPDATLLALVARLYRDTRSTEYHQLGTYHTLSHLRYANALLSYKDALLDRSLHQRAEPPSPTHHKSPNP